MIDAVLKIKWQVVDILLTQCTRYESQHRDDVKRECCHDDECDNDV